MFYCNNLLTLVYLCPLTILFTCVSYNIFVCKVHCSYVCTLQGVYKLTVKKAGRELTHQYFYVGKHHKTVDVDLGTYIHTTKLKIWIWNRW